MEAASSHFRTAYRSLADTSSANVMKDTVVNNTAMNAVLIASFRMYAKLMFARLGAAAVP